MSGNSIRLAVLLLTVYIFVFPASAMYDFNGFDLTTAAHGTVNGEIYVGGGHGLPLTTDPNNNVHTQDFTVPSGTVTFARLYVGLWGGKETYNGSLQTMFNGNDLGTLNLTGSSDTNPDVWCTGHGVYGVKYDVTSQTLNGFNTATATTNLIDAGFDGRTYGIVLVAVVENPAKTQVEYWINEGHWNLNYITPFNSATTEFTGAITNPDGKSTTLTTVYLTGEMDDGDILQFNDFPMISEAADGSGRDEWGNSWSAAFDIDTWDMESYGCSILHPTDNEITFDRANDPYLHPVLAVLQVRPKICGDVNVDNSITVTDAVMILNRAVKPGYILACPWEGDVNADSSFTVTDAVMILNRAVNPSYSLGCKCQSP